MKKYIVIIILLISISFISCRDENKTAEDKLETAIEEVKEDLKANSETLSDDVEDEINEIKEEAK